MGRRKRVITARKGGHAVLHKTRHRRSLFGWLAVLGLALASSGLSLVFAEIALRVFGLAPAVKPIRISDDSTVYRRSSNPILGFELKANYRNENADFVVSHLRTNAHGQRDIERTVVKPAGVNRIILLGDSVVEGEGIRDLNDTMSRALERLYPGDRTEVLNFGVSGYCTRAEVELLKEKGLKFDPDVVVIVFVENDFDNFNLQLFELGSVADRPEVVKRLFVASHLFRLSCLSFNLYEFGTEADTVQWNNTAIGDNNVADGLRLLRELADRYGFVPLIAVWPRFLDDGFADVHFMPHGSGELVIERLARANRIHSVRMSEHFRRHIESLDEPVNPRLRYTARGDKMHPNPQGCRLAARALKTILTELPSWVPPAMSPAGDDAERAGREAARAQGRQAPDYSAALLNLGNLLQSDGKLDEAIIQYRKALELYPDLAEAHSNLGIALATQGRAEEAVAHFHQAVELVPDSARAHFNLGRLLLAAKKLDAAIEHLGRAVAIDSEPGEMHAPLGIALALRGRLEEATTHLRLALKSSPADAEIHIRLGSALLLQHKWDESIQHYRQAAQIVPASARAHRKLADALAVAGHPREALDSYRTALQRRPDWPVAMAEMAWLLATHPDAAIRDEDQSILLSERAADISKRADPVVLDTLAAAYAAAGRFVDAVATGEQARDLAAKVGAESLERDIDARIELYRAGRPFRQARAPRGSMP